MFILHTKIDQEHTAPAADAAARNAKSPPEQAPVRAVGRNLGRFKRAKLHGIDDAYA